MGRTNIRSGHSFLQRGGSGIELISCIPEFNEKLVLVVARDFAEEDLDKHANLIRFGQDDMWHQINPVDAPSTALTRFQTVEADQPMQIPKVHVSSG